MITPLKAKLSEYKVIQTNIELTAHLILKIMLKKFYYKSNQKIINIQILRDSVILTININRFLGYRMYNYKNA